MSSRRSPFGLKPARGLSCEERVSPAESPGDVRRPEYVPAVLNISGNAALDVLIGLFFLYFLLSLVCSSINEGIAAAFRLRSKYLEKGLRKMLEGQENLDA